MFFLFLFSKYKKNRIFVTLKNRLIYNNKLKTIWLQS